MNDVGIEPCRQSSIAGGKTVAVVVPVFNAQRTIAATLRSILAQTHVSLDVVVVDDGSTDASMAIIAGLQADDARIRCLRQANAGAAAARNAGAALTNAPFLAFCDADDLWAPRKIELQLERMHVPGPAVALVYCWFARIDHADRVVAIDQSGGEGAPLPMLLRRNVIGNGSNALFRKAAFDAIGGFSDAFSPAEDLAIHLAAAERYDFGVVREVLVGYRMSDHGLSADGMAVYSATSRLLQTYWSGHPACRDSMTLHLRGVLMWQLARTIRRGRLLTAAQFLRMDLGVIWAVLTFYLPELVIGLLHGTLKDSWKGLLRRGGRQTFAAASDCKAMPRRTPQDRPSLTRFSREPVGP